MTKVGLAISFAFLFVLLTVALPLAQMEMEMEKGGKHVIKMIGDEGMFQGKCGQHSDGLADQWNEFGTPTTTLDTTIYLIGSQSQKVVTDAAGDDGIYSDNISDTETSGVGYAWVYKSSGDGIAVQLYDATASAIKDTALYAASGWETKVGANGNTWKRLVVSSDSLTSGNNHCLRIFRPTGGAAQATTFYVDQCYLELGTSTTPTGWCSGRGIDNTYDYQAGTRRINHVDVADIPGDRDADCQIIMKETGGSRDPQTLWIGMETKQPYALDLFNEYDGTVDAARSNGEYSSQTTSTTWTDVGVELQLGVGPPQGRFRAFGVVYDTHDDPRADFRVKWRTGAWDAWHYGDLKQVDVASEWQILDLGLVNFGHVVAPEYDAQFAGCCLEVRRTAGTEAIRADIFLLLPMDNALRIISVEDEYPVINALFVADTWYLVSDALIDPPKDYAINVSGGSLRYFTKIKHVGSEIRLPPMQSFRLWFLVSCDTALWSRLGHDPAQAMNVSFKYRPRGLHFRGSDL